MFVRRAFSTVAVTLAIPVVFGTISLEVSVGDEICIEGYVVDTRSVDHGTPLDDNFVETAKGLDNLSFSGLADSDAPFDFGYEVLVDKPGGEGLYCRGLKLDDAGNDKLRSFFARGGCETCENISPDGQTHGLRATILGEVTAVGNAHVPADIVVREVFDSSVGCGVADGVVKVPASAAGCARSENLPVAVPATGMGRSLMDTTIDWVWDTPVGETKIRVKQCGSIRFVWEGSDHDLVKFVNRAAYDTCTFDLSSQYVLVPDTENGDFTLSGKDTLNVGLRYYGCSESGHCDPGKMKVIVEVVPDLQSFDNFVCAKGRGRQVKAISKKECGMKCARQGARCRGYEFKPSVFKACKLFRQAPKKGAATNGASCAMARSSCG